jgi:hypothetical protein
VGAGTMTDADANRRDAGGNTDVDEKRCVDCDELFLVTAGEREFMASRCKPYRAERRAKRGGADAWQFGGWLSETSK